MEQAILQHYQRKRKAHWIGFFEVRTSRHQPLPTEAMAADFNEYLTYLRTLFLRSESHRFIDDVLVLVHVDQDDPNEYSIVPTMSIGICCNKNKLTHSDFCYGMAWIRDDLMLAPVRNRSVWHIDYSEHDSESISYRQGIDAISHLGRLNRVHQGCQFDMGLTGIWKR